MRTHSYGVPDISCGYCAAAISAEVGELPGVQSVVVDLNRTVSSPAQLIRREVTSNKHESARSGVSSIARSSEAEGRREKSMHPVRIQMNHRRPRRGGSSQTRTQLNRTTVVTRELFDLLVRIDALIR